MKFENIYWPDSQLIRIQIEYNQANLIIWNDALQKQILVKCFCFAGITNLCIWDDTIIMDAQVYPVYDSDNEFVRNLYTAYSKDIDYGGRSLSCGLLELKIELVNYIAFSVYCQKIEVEIQEDNTGDGTMCSGEE